MNKIEINNAFFEEPLMQYDAWMAIFTELLHNNDIINSWDKNGLIHLIEGKTWDLLHVLKDCLEENEKVFFSSKSYAYIYLLFTTLRKNKTISKENIRSFAGALNIQYPFPFPESDDIESSITRLNEEISSYTNFYLSQKIDKDVCVINKVACYDIIAEPEKSLKVLQNHLESDPKNSENNRKLWAYLYQLWNHNEAITYLKKAIELDLSNEKAYNDIINVYWSKQNHENIIKHCLKYTYENKGSNPFYILMWDAYESLGKYEKAIESYSSSEVTQYSIRRLLDIWNQLFNAKALEWAKKSYLEIIKVKPDYYFPYNQMWLIFYEQEDFEEALIYFKKALSLEIYDADIYTNLAFTCYELWEEDEIEAYLNKAISLSPKKTYLESKDILLSLLMVKEFVKERLYF